MLLTNAAKKQKVQGGLPAADQLLFHHPAKDTALRKWVYGVDTGTL